MSLASKGIESISRQRRHAQWQRQGLSRGHTIAADSPPDCGLLFQATSRVCSMVVISDTGSGPTCQAAASQLWCLLHAVCSVFRRCMLEVSSTLVQLVGH